MINRPEDDNGRRIANLIGVVAAVILIGMGLLLLLQLQHIIARRDCYQPHVGACAHIGAGRYPHF